MKGNTLCQRSQKMHASNRLANVSVKEKEESVKGNIRVVVRVSDII